MHHRIATGIMEGYVRAGHSQDEAERYAETYLQRYPTIPRPSYDVVKKRIEETYGKPVGEDFQIPETSGSVATSYQEEKQGIEKKVDGQKKKTLQKRNDVIQAGEDNATSFAQWGEIYSRKKKTTNAWTNPKHKVKITHRSKGEHKGTGRYSGRN
jgi:hypothetical protein